MEKIPLQDNFPSEQRYYGLVYLELCGNCVRAILAFLRYGYRRRTERRRLKHVNPIDFISCDVICARLQ